MTPRPRITLDDIEPVLRRADFAPDHVILWLDLPDQRDCKAVSMTDALDYLAEVGRVLTAGPTRIARWQRELRAAAREGYTPCVMLWSGPDGHAYISVDGFMLRPIAQA